MINQVHNVVWSYFKPKRSDPVVLPHSALSELFQATLDESSSFQAVEVLVEQWPRHPESAGQLTDMGRLRL
ncbi:hypothetical protein KACC15558_28430 [Brevibacterium ammoniilyticum]|uniref:Uncharacterized protein n=1 Tax=Brevibacterium ammoniilyticum TaxID=1046555 RepID=A0ABP9U4M5_9MICO